MKTVVEFADFNKKAEKNFGTVEREKIVELLSNNLHAGKKAEDFGGIHKLEWVEHGKKIKEYNIYITLEQRICRW